MLFNIKFTDIILASKSPRRMELMKQAGYDFKIVTSDTPEITTKTAPFDVSMELSSVKAFGVANSLSLLENDTLIIGADTVVFCDDEIMGKPSDYDDAFRMLKKLQNKTHQVYTGVTLLHYTSGNSSPKVKSFYEKTAVHVCPMTDDEINSYINTKDSFDKAGAYGIQGPFAIHIEKINGDYNNVVGLPISRLYHEINNFSGLC